MASGTISRRGSIPEVPYSAVEAEVPPSPVPRMVAPEVGKNPWTSFGLVGRVGDTGVTSTKEPGKMKIETILQPRQLVN